MFGQNQPSTARQVEPSDHDRGYRELRRDPDWWIAAGQEASQVAQGRHIVYGITTPEWCSAYAAIARANCAGEIADFSVNVSWSTVGVVGETAVAFAQATYIASLQRWHMFRLLSHTIVATLEVGRTFGLHSHLQLAVPIRFQIDCAEACRRLLLIQLGRDLIDTPDIKTIEIKLGKRSLDTQWTRLRYQAKGLSPFATLPYRPGDPGFVPLSEFAEIKLKDQGRIAIPRMQCFSNVRFPANTLLPDMTIRIGGPQLYGDQFINFNRKLRGLKHFDDADLAPRDARHLMICP